jgi:hypothetical protein
MRVLFLLSLILGGCAARTHPPLATRAVVVETVNFDETSYQAILAAGTLIEKTNAELATSETYPPSVAVNVRPALAYLIDSYHDTQHAYMNYHKAVIGGFTTAEVQQQYDALARHLYDLSVKTKALEAAKKG